MQVNSAQDYLTAKKRQLNARAIRSTPQSRRTNELYTSVLANGASQRERFVAPYQGARAGPIGGATYSSLCCSTGGPLAIGFVINTGVTRPPMLVYG